MTILFNFPSNYIYQQKGSRNAVLTGMVLMTIGAMIKVFVNSNFAYLFVGHVIQAIGSPFIWNGPTQIGQEWFLPDERLNAVNMFVTS
jgi:MFS family permease